MGTKRRSAGPDWESHRPTVLSVRLAAEDAARLKAAAAVLGEPASAVVRMFLRWALDRIERAGPPPRP